MRIALFTTGIYPFMTGGMQKHSYYLAKYLAQNKVYVDIYHYVLHDKELVQELESFSSNELEYIRHFCFHFDKPSFYPGHYIMESYSISKKYYETFLKNSDVDFVYAQGFSGWYFSKQKKSGQSLPLIGVNFHGLEMYQHASSLKSKLSQYLFYYPVKRCMNLSDYIYSLGGKLTQILINLGYNKNKIIEVPIGISQTWIINDKCIETTHYRKFVFIGRYEERKGIKELTSVLKDLEKDNIFEFHFIGPIPKDKQLNSSKIIYHGLMKDESKIKNILSEADVLITPSYSEGMPTVILEAMASGCAIIATDVGAVREQVDKTNGILLDSCNVETIKKSILDMIEFDNAKINKMKHKSIQRVIEKFQWENVIISNIHRIQRVIFVEK